MKLLALLSLTFALFSCNSTRLENSKFGRLHAAEFPFLLEIVPDWGSSPSIRWGDNNKDAFFGLSSAFATLKREV